MKNDPLLKLVRNMTPMEERMDRFMMLVSEWKSKYKQEHHKNILLMGRLNRTEAYQENRKLKGLFVLRTTNGKRLEKKYKTYEDAVNFAKYNVSNHPEIRWDDVYSVIVV